MKWKPIPEMVDEDSNQDTCYSTKINGRFYWVMLFDDNRWYVEANVDGEIIKVNKRGYKTEKGAQNWLEKNIDYVEERYFE